MQFPFLLQQVWYLCVNGIISIGYELFCLSSSKLENIHSCKIGRLHETVRDTGINR